ncbi:MAG: hypothetical protein MUQ32_02575 [Chloroflexi bacterium]|nr:hypothetical protein [Chloroflexota bacterium]
MQPALLLTFLVAGLLALLPVWRLHRAGWPSRSLTTAWIIYALGIFVGVRFPGPFRLLLPILILLYVAPFVAGPERLARVLRGRRPDQGVIIDVTPRPAPSLPEPPREPNGAKRGKADAGDPNDPAEADDAGEAATSGPGKESDPR